MNTKTNIIQLERKTERWANRIREAHSKSVESTIEVGRLLIEAKADCDHGEWGEITGETTGKPMLPFKKSTAQAFMAIARHPFLSNPQHVGDLPPYWGTLAELSQLPPHDLEADLKAGRIHPDMTRADAVALRKPEQPPNQFEANACYMQFTEKRPTGIDHARPTNRTCESQHRTDATHRLGADRRQYRLQRRQWQARQRDIQTGKNR